MGLEILHVLSDEGHYSHYECVICQSLVDLDCLVTTVCSHCFCRTCLAQWLGRKSSNYNNNQEYATTINESPPNKTCPTCHNDLLYANNQNNNGAARHLPTMMIGSDCVLVQPLERCQPLAHRVLKRIKVACPLQGTDCEWQGDYSDLSEHLLSPTAHAATSSGRSPTEDVASKAERGGDLDNSKRGDASTTTTRTNDNDPEADESSPSHNMRKVAESYKEQANTKFASQHYDQARDLYTQALHVLAVRPASDAVDRPLDILEAKLLSNRAACHCALRNYPAAIDDTNTALQKDPTYTKAALRLARSHVQLGNFEKAVESLIEAATHCTDPKLLTQEMVKTKELEHTFMECQAALLNQEYANAKLLANTLFRTTRAEVVLLAAAEADLGLGLTDSAARFSLAVLKDNPRSVHGYVIRGQASILSNDLQTGKELLKQGIRFDPDDEKIRSTAKRWIQLSNRIKQARGDFFRRRFEICVETRSQIIPACPILPPKSLLYASLHAERAKGWLRLKDYEASLKDCALVLYHQDDHVDAWLTRFSALHGLERHQEVLDETTDLMSKWGQGDEQIRQAWQKADFEVRKAKRPDYYDILGVSRIASEKEIKSAFRKKSLDYHPDRFVGPEHTAAQRKEAATKFQQLGDALEILTHEFSKQLYDEGYDMDAIRERLEAAQRAARQRNNPHGSSGGGAYPHHHQ